MEIGLELLSFLYNYRAYLPITNSFTTLEHSPVESATPVPIFHVFKMVGPGGGPPRKSHTKSRNGCKTCKRRHIRCDETFPQWYVPSIYTSIHILTASSRNCTKHNCRCDYQDTAATQGGSPSPPRRGPDLLISPEIEMEIDNWHRTGVPPYPELLQCPRSGWSGLSRTDLRLVHHIIGLSIDLHRRGLSGCTVWAQKMPK